MALEAYIYDYSARKLTDSFVQKHLDKLDLASKFVVAIQLISGKKFPKDMQVYSSIRKLIRNRNALIHSKSSNVDIKNEKKLIDISKAHHNVYDSAREAIIALDCVGEYINSIDPDESVSMYLKHTT